MLTELFCTFAHHQRCIVILICQNPFMYANSRNAMQTVVKTCTYIVLFASRLTLSIARTLCRTYFYGEEHRLLEPFRSIINSESRDYIVIEPGAANVDHCVILNGVRDDNDAYYFTFTK